MEKEVLSAGKANACGKCLGGSRRKIAHEEYTHLNAETMTTLCTYGGTADTAEGSPSRSVLLIIKMKKIEQLIKELQMLVGNEEMNTVIDEKLWSAWRDARQDCDKEWILRHEAYWNNYKKWLTNDDIERMSKSHHFVQGSDEEESCYKCDLDVNDFQREPQYCENKEL